MKIYVLGAGEYDEHVVITATTDKELAERLGKKNSTLILTNSNAQKSASSRCGTALSMPKENWREWNARMTTRIPTAIATKCSGNGATNDTSLLLQTIQQPR